MSLTYGGIPLIVPDAALTAWVAGNISTADVYEFEDEAWPGTRRYRWAYRGHVEPPPIKLMSLYWPATASRWAVGHFVAFEQTVVALRLMAFQSGTLTALPFHWDDGTNVIETSLFMLPPRPLSQFSAQGTYDGCYLLTLVDERYFWWMQSASIDVDDSATWAGLYSSAAIAVGASFSNDSINGAYLTPAKSLTAEYEYLPILLDAIAYNVGQRIVRKLDGTTQAQNYATAKASLTAQLSLPWPIDAGGAIPATDKAAMVPASTTLVFPAAAPEEWCLDIYGNTKNVIFPGGNYTVTTTLGSLVLSDLPVAGYAGSKFWHDEATKIDNTGELTSLAQQFSTDWYLWQTGFLDVAFTGIRPWIPEGLHGSVEWTLMANLVTRIQRPTWNDLTENLNHRSTYGTIDVTDRMINTVQTPTSLDDNDADMDGDVVAVDKLLLRKGIFEDLTVSTLTVLCGEDNACAGTILDIAWEDRCESGDLNKYKITTTLEYVDGCLTPTSQSEVFVERVGYCKDCDPIRTPFTTTRCINNSLYLFTFNQVFVVSQNCLMASIIEYVGGERIACNVDCCQDSGSGSGSGSTCTATECGTVSWVCTAVEVCLQNHCITSYEWVPLGGWETLKEQCPSEIVSYPLFNCDSSQEDVVVEMPCCCCGLSYWLWNATTGIWDGVSSNCIFFGGVASYPTSNGTVDGEVAVTCCCCDQHSGSGTSGSSTSPCCGCGAYPNQFRLTIAGVPAAACPPLSTGDCDLINGDWILTATLSPVCQWQSDPQIVCGVTAQSMWTLYCDGTYYYAKLSGINGYVIYRRSIADWVVDGCAASHTMDLFDASNSPICQFAGFADTITLTPIP